MTDFNKIIEEKRKLLLGDPSLSHVGLGAIVDTFQPMNNETVQIIQFSDDGKTIETKEVKILIGQEIGKGSMRTAFQLVMDNDDSYVIKISNQIPMTFNDIINDNLTLELASLYAIQYNKLNPPKLLSINKAFIIKFTQRVPILIAQGEPFMNGEYTKYNNNSTYINEDVKRNTPQAFSHFTLHASKNTQVITDVQGVGDVYTDLQVHTVTDIDKYSKGNLGIQGIIDFTRTHKCNAVCKYLKINFTDSSLIDFGVTLTFDKNQEEADQLLRLAVIFDNSGNTLKAVEYYKRSAELGNSNAYNSLGVIYHDGSYLIEPDILKSIEYYKKAAEKNNSCAYFNLGDIYEKGTFEMPPDNIKSFEYFNKSAELGFPEAYNRIGLIYIRGKGSIKQDIKKSIEYFNKGVELESSNSLVNLGLMYCKGNSEIQPDIKKCLEYLQKAGEMKNPEAFVNLGSIYLSGKDGLLMDVKKAIEYYHQAAGLGSSIGFYYIGTIYFSGQGEIKKDIMKAFQYFQSASTLGDGKALNSLGFMYENGADNIIPKNISQAVSYYERAAQFGNADALYNLGCIYHYGKGEIKANLKLSKEYFQQSSDLGNSYASTMVLLLKSDESEGGKQPPPCKVQ